ncbi:MAG: alpha-mannosidase [Chloroflexota bacterium]|nr:alpha-mannosidase [Chloroflexota bacterium]
MLFFTVEKIAKLLPEIRAAIHRDAHPLPHWKVTIGAPEGAHRPDFDDSGWEDFEVPGRWGSYDVTAWFRTTVHIPEHLRAGDKKLALHLVPGPRDGGDSTAESMLYVDGEPLQALDLWHEQAWLPPELVERGELAVAIHAWSGVQGVPEERRFTVAQLVWIDEATERFYYLANTLHRAIQVLDEDDLRRLRLLDTLNQAFNRINFTKPQSEAFYASVADAECFLREAVESMHTLEELKPTVVAVGHAHIDMAWLWRLAHTREKAGRTFATALHLMRQYPEYRFVHSSPQLYRYLEQDYPQLFARVKERIEAGQWEATGGMWVESDINLPSGESLVRQILFGKRYEREALGVDSHVLWLPDVFGYSAALPQIIRKSGLHYFMTTKISWNQFNRFPYDTFRWRGVDGTEVLTHFVTTPEDNWYYTYSSLLSPRDVKGVWENYRQKEINDELLVLFGRGDGGGGPYQEMLEAARAMKNLPGIPRVEMGRAEPYFRRLEERLAEQVVPVWDGELYLEYHRGTYTSQAWLKRANRKAEVLYHDVEWFSTLAELLTEEAAYPHDRLREGWELILLNQFHDILPGSSIRPVYEDAEEDYEVINRVGEEVLAQAQRTLLQEVPAQQRSVVVFNSLSWPRDGLISLPWSEEQPVATIIGPDGRPAPVQLVEEAGQPQILLPLSGVPSLGYRAYSLVPATLPAHGVDPHMRAHLLRSRYGVGIDEEGHLTVQEAPLENPLTITKTHLENPWYRIELDEQGRLTSLFDKLNQREVLAAGTRGNVFQAFEDKPMAFDAWDIDLYYQEKMWEIDDLVEAEVEESGPLRGVLRLQWRYHDSTITQRLTIYRDSPRIDFRTEVEWQEQQVLLKVAFPVNVRATRATYEIQFGNVERPTHWNTSWDYARFEVVGHKWVDLSEGNYGVALLNDSKYGHDIKDNVLRLTLIKSSIRPDPLADKGMHYFTYSLLPHAGTWRESDVVQQAYALNYPLLTATIPAKGEGRLPRQYQFATLDSDHVILETVKKAEAEEAYIVRLYEYKQYRSNQVTLRFAQPIRRAVECNLIEEEERPIPYEANQLTFPITPYEIKTFKVWLERSS